MSTTVFLAVIFGALLHATWNALVKGGADKLVNMAGVIIGHVPLAIIALMIFPSPDPASWPYMIGGVICHTGYQFFLLSSYKLGDLTQVYPIARGSAPLIVTGISVFFLGERLEFVQWLAVLLIACGIISIGLVRSADGLRNPKAAWSALITGCFIAGYSLIDGMGGRVSGSPIAFYCWLGITNAVVFGLMIAMTRRDALTKLATTAAGRRVFLIGGSASFTAYALVMWAFTQAPIALVTALRETSIVFALLIGVFIMKERLDLSRVISCMVILSGSALLKFSR